MHAKLALIGYLRNHSSVREVVDIQIHQFRSGPFDFCGARWVIGRFHLEREKGRERRVLGCPYPLRDFFSVIKKPLEKSPLFKICFVSTRDV